MRKNIISNFLDIQSCLSHGFSHFVYKESAPKGQEGQEGERISVPGVETPKEKKERQDFALGEHEVLAPDRLSQDYVSQISGSVDFHEFARESKNNKFYKDEISKSAVLLLDLYTKNKAIFTDSALMYIEENLSTLRRLAASVPKSHAEFAKVVEGTSENAIYGPDGVLNLLLAFNRVVSKLQPNALLNMGDPREQQLLKIDLRKRATRSVEVSLFMPEITYPDISKIELDVPNLELPQKRMKTDGTYEVAYFSQTEDGERKLELILDIDPQKQTVRVTRYYWREKTNTVIGIISIAEFDRRLSTKPYFLDGFSGH